MMSDSAANHLPRGPASDRSGRRSSALRTRIRRHARAAYQGAILEAAAAVFGRVGFQDAKMTDIAAQAGVSVGTLYNYFANKDAVVSSLITHEHQRFLARLEGLEDIRDPMERIRRVLAASLSYIEERGALIAMAIPAGLLHRHATTGRCGEDEDRAFRQVLRLYERACADAIAAGQIRSEFEPNRLATVLDGIVRALVFDWVRSGRKRPLLPQSEFVLDLVMHGAVQR